MVIDFFSTSSSSIIMTKTEIDLGLMFTICSIHSCYIVRTVKYANGSLKMHDSDRC